MRLLVEPPVLIVGTRFTHSLTVISTPYPGYPPYGIIRFALYGKTRIDEHYNSGGHAYHVIKNGFKLRIPSIYSPFFERLIAEGRAEYIWGPHSALGYRPVLHDLPGEFHPDARYSYRPAVTQGELDIAPPAASIITAGFFVA